MAIIYALTAVGTILTVGIALIALSVIFTIQLEWRCGLCGKLNEGSLLKFLLQWCDHMGDY